MRFGVVGVGATLTHAITLVLCVELLAVPVLAANVVAFISALPVSYFGHQRWTFEADSEHGAQAPKFIATAVGGFLVNEAVLWVVHHALGFDYRIGAFVAIGTSAVTVFLLSKLWVFRQSVAS